ncbi:MAG: hypothetical protein HKN33_03730 [Pyrinomonadaceae bacterium]|nr:hypothetical protein [Pyrinomonadaceae bacterium]
MKTEVNHLELEFSVTNQEIVSTDEFEARATFTNRSKEDMQLSTLFLEFGPILLKTRYADGSPVNPASPPFPPLDDGKVGRINLKPGESKSYVYRGVDYFSEPLPEGKYQVRFRHENMVAKYGDWIGTIETEWIAFEIREPDEPSQTS